MADSVKYLLDETRIPKRWYNIMADLPSPPPPVLLAVGGRYGYHIQQRLAERRRAERHARAAVGGSTLVARARVSRCDRPRRVARAPLSLVRIHGR